MNLKKLFLAVAVVVPFLFTSCESSDTTTPKLALQGDIEEVGNNFIAYVKVTCPAEGALKSVTAEYIYNDGKSEQQVKSSDIVITKTNDQAWLAGITFPKVSGEYAVETLAVRAETKDGGNATEKFAAPAEAAIEYTVTKVNVEAGKTYAYKQGDNEGTFKVTTAKAGEVEIEIGDKKIVLLSDAGSSYMLTSFVGAGFADASADASKVLFCLLSNSTTIASPTEAASDAIKAGNETKFAATAIN